MKPLAQRAREMLLSVFKYEVFYSAAVLWTGHGALKLLLSIIQLGRRTVIWKVPSPWPRGHGGAGTRFQSGCFCPHTAHLRASGDPL